MFLAKVVAAFKLFFILVSVNRDYFEGRFSLQSNLYSHGVVVQTTPCFFKESGAHKSQPDTLCGFTDVPAPHLPANSPSAFFHLSWFHQESWLEQDTSYLQNHLTWREAGSEEWSAGRARVDRGHKWEPCRKQVNKNTEKKRARAGEGPHRRTVG